MFHFHKSLNLKFNTTDYRNLHFHFNKLPADLPWESEMEANFNGVFNAILPFNSSWGQLYSLIWTSIQEIENKNKNLD